MYALHTLQSMSAICFTSPGQIAWAVEAVTLNDG